MSAENRSSDPSWAMRFAYRDNPGPVLLQLMLILPAVFVVTAIGRANTTPIPLKEVCLIALFVLHGVRPRLSVGTDTLTIRHPLWVDSYPLSSVTGMRIETRRILNDGLRRSWRIILSVPVLVIETGGKLPVVVYSDEEAIRSMHAHLTKVLWAELVRSRMMPPPTQLHTTDDSSGVGWLREETMADRTWKVDFRPSDNPGQSAAYLVVAAALCASYLTAVVWTSGDRSLATAIALFCAALITLIPYHISLSQESIRVRWLLWSNTYPLASVTGVELERRRILNDGSRRSWRLFVEVPAVIVRRGNQRPLVVYGKEDVLRSLFDHLGGELVSRARRCGDSGQ